MFIEPRPYLKKFWPELKDLAQNKWSNSEDLQIILSELKYRKAVGAIKLSQQIIDQLYILSEEQFLWPSTAIMPSKEALNADQYWFEDGMLSFLGYHVGQKGVSTDRRHLILDYVFNSKLPNVNSIEYMQEWSKPSSGFRLKKIANTLATLTKNAKRSKNNLSLATDQWEVDLKYLKEKYYNGKYDFTWPKTHII